MRIIEAVRGYAATHDKTLPQSLAEITNVPVPADPITNQPFQWNVAEGVGTLTAPPAPEALVPAYASDFWARNLGVEYRLRLR
ncbi:MAG: hypothetical protein MUF06_19665 [Pirellulaceae bacterium]|nr:hypothetical protein [Pirellulaceae bacterium]